MSQDDQQEESQTDVPSLMKRKIC